ncbi:MAG: DNA replication and repair protein RecF [bacterium]|nr:DNA replication and repair protein RecF [bacterium]
MRLKSIQISHFRNITRQELQFAAFSPIVLVGDNGEGKTNFLQALVVLALSKSFQGIPLREMVNWAVAEDSSGLPPFFSIRGVLATRDGDQELEVICGQSRKFPRTLKLNGLKMQPQDYIGHFRIVLFTPQDLNLLFLAPRLRRRYTDFFLSQIDREYLDQLLHYQAVLKHRNKLLDAVLADPGKLDQLEYWDDKLALHGGYLLWRRRGLFDVLNRRLSSFYSDISGESSVLRLQWKKSWDGNTSEQISISFRQYLREKQSRDIEARMTCGGPHREDFQFFMNDRSLSESGSRGECRTAILSLKLAELEYMKSLTGDSPVVLFDDVFSELDEHRQKNLLSRFDADQVFITSTHLDFELEKGVFWRVESGSILT